MILFSVGTERFPFDRLVQAAEQAAAKLKGESVFIQLGHSTYVPHGCFYTRFLSYEELLKRIAEARIVVTHAGAGSILSCLRLGKVPIVVPRRKQFGEHVDDHQFELARKMAELNHVLLAKDPQEVLSLILNYEKDRPALADFSSSVPALAHALSEYLQSDGATTATREREAAVYKGTQ